MSSAGRKPWLPPRWVIRTAWSVHRALYRISGGHLGLSLPRDKHYGLLRLTVSGHRPAALAVDGRMIDELGPGDAIECTASSHRARLVVFGPRDFHRILKAKFRLSDR